MTSYMDMFVYYPVTDFILSYLPSDIDYTVTTILSQSSLFVSLGMMLFGFNKLSSCMYLFSYLCDVLKNRLMRSAQTSVDLLKHDVRSFNINLALHVLFFLGLLAKYWEGFNLFTILVISMCLVVFTFYQASMEALMVLEETGDSDDFLRMHRKRTKVIIAPNYDSEQESAEELTSASSDEQMQIDLVWFRLRGLYLVIYESMWNMYNYANRRLYKMEPTRKVTVEDKRSYIQSNVRVYSAFGRGNLITINCLMLFLNLWGFNGIALFNSVNKVLLFCCIAPIIYLTKHVKVGELLAENHIRVDWWSVVATIILCYAQVNVVWIMGLFILRVSI